MTYDPSNRVLQYNPNEDIKIELRKYRYDHKNNNNFRSVYYNEISTIPDIEKPILDLIEFIQSLRSTSFCKDRTKVLKLFIVYKI